MVEEEELGEEKIERFKAALLSGFPNRPKLYEKLYGDPEDDKEIEEREITSYEEIQEIESLIQMLDKALPANSGELNG